MTLKFSLDSKEKLRFGPRYLP